MSIHDEDPVDENGFLDGAKRAAQKQASRDRDQAMLDSGEITLAELKHKNDWFANVDFSKVHIESVGGVPYKDLNKSRSKRIRVR